MGQVISQFLQILLDYLEESLQHLRPGILWASSGPHVFRAEPVRQHCTAMHCTALHYNTLHCTVQCAVLLHYVTSRSTAQAVFRVFTAGRHLGETDAHRCSAQCTVYSEQCTVYSEQCTVHSKQ